MLYYGKRSEIEDNDFDYFEENHDELSETLRLLKSNINEESIKLSDWKNRMILYHDELWGLLYKNEPEKYRRDCPLEKL